MSGSSAYTRLDFAAVFIRINEIRFAFFKRKTAVAETESGFDGEIFSDFRSEKILFHLEIETQRIAVDLEPLAHRLDAVAFDDFTDKNRLRIAERFADGSFLPARTRRYFAEIAE